VVGQGADDELFSSPAGRDAWARVGTMTGSNLAVSGKVAWFGTSTAGASTYLWATADGVHWRKYPFSCPAGLPWAGGRRGGQQLAGGVPVRRLGGHVSLGQGGAALGEHRQDRAPDRAGPVAGDVAGFAVPPPRATVITIAVVTPGLSYLYRSANGGKTWTEIAVSSLTGEVSFTSLPNRQGC
jgi:hypothetical protein